MPCPKSRSAYNDIIEIPVYNNTAAEIFCLPQDYQGAGRANGRIIDITWQLLPPNYLLLLINPANVFYVIYIL